MKRRELYNSRMARWKLPFAVNQNNLLCLLVKKRVVDIGLSNKSFLHPRAENKAMY